MLLPFHITNYSHAPNFHNEHIYPILVMSYERFAFARGLRLRLRNALSLHFYFSRRFMRGLTITQLDRSKDTSVHISACTGYNATCMEVVACSNDT